VVGAAGLEPALSGCIARGATATLSAVAPVPDRKVWTLPGAELESASSVTEVFVSPRRVYTTTGANCSIHQTL
jgi:hypothetical protein